MRQEWNLYVVRHARFGPDPGYQQPTRNGAVSRCRPGSPALQRQGHSRVRRQGTGASDGGRFRFTEHRVSVLTPVLGVLGGSRTRTVSDLGAVPPTELGYEDVEPPPGADPGHPPYEGGAAAVRGGVGWGIRIRT